RERRDEAGGNRAGRFEQVSWRQNLALAVRPPKNRAPRAARRQQAAAAPGAAPQAGQPGAAPGTAAQPGAPRAAPAAPAPATGRRGFRRRGQAQQAQLAAQAASAGAVAPTELAQRRERAAAQLVELQWDLGGLTYEMARRDHFRLDVLVSQAAKLQQVDA